MKSKIKILSLLMAIAMGASVFAGCGDKNGNDNNGASGTGDNSAKKDVVELTWWQYGTQPKDEAAIAALNKKSAEDIGVTVNFIFTGEEEKIKTALSTGADDDITFTCSWFADYSGAAQKNQFLDLTEIVKSQTPTLYNTIPEYVWEGSKVNGKIFAVPVYKDTAAIYYYRVNKDYVLDGAGLQSEFDALGNELSTATPLLKKIKEYNDAGNPYPGNLSAPLSHDKGGWKGLTAANWDQLSSILIGCRPDDPNYKVTSYLTDEAWLNDVRTLSEWYKAGYINQDAPYIDQNPGYYVFDEEQGYEGAEAEWMVGKDFTISIKQRTQPIATNSTITGAMNGIFANSKHPEEALKYLEYINTNKEYRNMLAYGVEGTNFEVNDGVAKILNTDFSMSPWAQANLFLLYPTEPATADMYERVEAQMRSPETSKLLGFAFDISSVRNEIGACTTAMEKYMTDLRTGAAKDVDATVKKMLDEMNSAGYQKVIEECQKQVDAFLGK